MITLLKKNLLNSTIVVVALTLLLGCAGNSPGNISTQPDNSQALVLANILQLAKQGKVINCEFTAKTTVIDEVQKKWGDPDKTDWVPAAKGSYATYAKHGAVFGFNKGLQIFEVRSFDPELKKITLAKLKETLGTPPYATKYNGEDIIGYTAGPEFKILFVFAQVVDSAKDPVLDHYSVLYPEGTVNSMAGDPGRQW